MYKLQVVPKADELLPAGPPVTISIGPDGGLGIHCDDDPTYQWLSSLLSERLFVPGLGFPRFQRGDDGTLTRGPDDGRFIVSDYVDFAAPAEDLLQAIEDNLEGIGQFDLTHVPDSP
ncbi:MAG: hypothetical protein H7338_23290 [Candidatus Sericytochromatia bacterium]|nr:hypothetical protein [Candidatus Sericytochromatia bacterium]